MDKKKHIGVVMGGMEKSFSDEIIIFTVTDETKLQQCKYIAGICKKAVFISLTTELFYVYRDGEFKMVVPKHLKI